MANAERRMSRSIQEIEAQLNNSSDDRQTIDLLIELAWQMRNSDTRRALVLSQQALEKSITADYVSGQAYALRNLSRCYTLSSDYEAALTHGLDGVALFEMLDDQRGLALTLNIIGQIHWEVGDYSEALNVMLRFLDIAQHTNDHLMQADALNNVAMIYTRMEAYEKALAMLEESLPLFQKADSQRGYIFARNNIAMIHSIQGNYDQALDHAQEMLELAEQAGLLVLQVGLLDTLGQIYLGMGEYASALEKMEASLAMAAELDLKRNVLIARINMARIYLQKDQLDEAHAHLQEALNLTAEIESKPEQAQTHQLLSEVYEKMGDVQKALVHFKFYHETEKKIFNDESDRKLVGLEVRYRTEAARREAEIYRLKNVALEEEIAERKRIEVALIKAKQAADRANRAKSEFLSNMSHELRTPLNGILGYTQILRRDQWMDESHANAINVIHQSGEHLLTLINDILDISKIEAGKLDLQPTNVHLYRLLEVVVDIMQMRAQQKGLRFTYEIGDNVPTGINADDKRLRQILINLVGNAIKFTEKGEVKLLVTSRDVGSLPFGYARLRFEVIDTGVGIAAEDIEKIFQPLVQVGDRQTRAEGTGLGLSISQRLVRAMGGAIHVESELGKGSRFWFELELPTAVITLTEAAATQPHIIGYEGERRKVLIVDDKAHNREVLVNLLEPLGFEVFEAADGNEALQLAVTLQPHVIITDLVMPKMTGFEAVQLMRKQPELADSIIIAVSASIFEDAQDDSLMAGCNAFLPKPIDITQLLAVLETQLKLKWQTQILHGPTGAVTSTTTQLNEDDRPSDAFIHEIYDLALMGDLLTIGKRMVELEQEEPSLASFSQHLKQLAANFEEEKILAILERLMSNEATQDE